MVIRSFPASRPVIQGLIAALLLSVSTWAASPHLKMGNPSSASANPEEKDNYLLEKDYFALSYNNSRGVPNWVSWRLTKSDLGDADRVPFYPDPDLPKGFKKVTPNDYTGTGFDRGHLCPHSDRSATPEMSRATFAMSNIIPQSPNVNQKAWNQLELYCRNLVTREHKVLYIVAGPSGEGGEGKNGPWNEIGKARKITVPSRCWKVILVLDEGEKDDLEKVDENTRIISVIMPNDMNVTDDWRGFRVPLKTVEQLTGYKFFSQVPEKVLGPLKEEADKVRVREPRPIERGRE